MHSSIWAFLWVHSSRVIYSISSSAVTLLCHKTFVCLCESYMASLCRTEKKRENLLTKLLGINFPYKETIIIAKCLSLSFLQLDMEICFTVFTLRKKVANERKAVNVKNSKWMAFSTLLRKQSRRKWREHKYNILPSKVTIFSLSIYKTTSHNRKST